MDYEVADTVKELIEILEKLPPDAKLDMSVGGETTDTVWVTHEEKYNRVSLWVS